MTKSIKITFLALLAVFIYVMFGQQFLRMAISEEWFMNSAIAPLIFWLPYLIFISLSVRLIILVSKEKVEGKLRKFLLLTGIAPLVMFGSIILHNLVYGLFIVLFGENFWERIGIGDEPFFFILAVIICPIAFLVGATGTIVLFIKEKK